MRRGTKRGSHVREWLWTPLLLVDVDIVWTADVDTWTEVVAVLIGGIATDAEGTGAPAAAALANEVGGAARVTGATAVAAVGAGAPALAGVEEGAAGVGVFTGTDDAPLFADAEGDEGCSPLPPPTGALATKSFMDRTALSTLFLGPLIKTTRASFGPMES
jgi:hypothetical protein